MKKITYAVTGLIGSMMVSAPAFAALDLTTFTMGDGIGNVETIFMAIVGGLVTLWGLRKIVKVMNRS